MKALYAMILMIGSTQAALAMPCDTGYKCVSKSGKYEISLQRCRYSNSLGLEEVSIAKAPVKDATLGPAYDGNSILAFEIELPAQKEDQRRLTVELPRIGHAGIVREEIQEYNPGPFKTIASESITCQIED